MVHISELACVLIGPMFLSPKAIEINIHSLEKSTWVRTYARKDACTSVPAYAVTHMKGTSLTNVRHRSYAFRETLVLNLNEAVYNATLQAAKE